MMRILSPWPFAVLLGCALLGIVAPAAAADVAPRLGDLSAQQPAGTREMIARLDRLWRESDPLKNFYLSTAAIAPSALELDHAYTLREDESAPRELRLPRLTFATGAADGGHHHPYYADTERSLPAIPT
jgi:hypothetical protein